MSETYAATAKALAADPELKARVMAADSSEARGDILREAGVPVPTHEDIASGVGALAGVAGGSNTATDISHANDGAQAASIAGA